MQILESKKAKKDTGLTSAISYEIQMADTWNLVIEKLLKMNEEGLNE